MAGFNSVTGLESIVNADNASFDGTERGGAMTTNGEFWIGSTASPHVKKGTLTSPDSSLTIGYSSPNVTLEVTGGTTTGKTITGNTGGALLPTGGNWNILGNNSAQNGFASYATGIGSTLTMNSYGTAKWVVNPTSGIGTHTTISSAIASAVSGETIFITPGTYTENITLKAGVNLAAYTCDAFTPNVTISGTCTMTTAGTVSISGIRLQTNSSALLAVTGSSASIVNITDCYLNCTNSTGITFSSSSSSSRIFIDNCRGDVGTTGIGLFAHSSSGSMTIIKSTFGNSGGSSTASTCSSGVLNLLFFTLTSPITLSSTASGTWEHGLIDCSPQSVISLTLGGSGLQSLKWCRINSGSASAVSISTAAILQFCTIGSTNTNAITGSGTIQASVLSFDGSSSTINTTTQTPLTSRFGIQRSTTQPAFLAFATTQSNVTGDNTAYTITFNTEIFDQNNNFNGVSTFTAPVTGRYRLNADIIFNDVGIAHTGCIMTITTSNRAYYFNYFNIGVANSSGVQFGVQSVLADMDVGDTAVVTVQIANGTKVVDINALSNFAGSLEF